MVISLSPKIFARTGDDESTTSLPATQRNTSASCSNSDTLTIDDGDGFVVTQSGATVGEWPSEAALAADVAAFITLQEWLPGWEDLIGQTRDELIGRLRIFLEQCPACEGTLETEPRKADPEIPHVVCADCGSAMV